MNYRPTIGAATHTVAPGELAFAATHFDHGHIYGQIAGLAAAGGELKWVFDPQPARYKAVLQEHPNCRVARSLDEVLEDPGVALVTSAAIPDQRCALGLQVLQAGKDYLTDKSPFTTLEQLDQAKACVAQTGRKYMCSYSERLLSEATYYAGELVRQGAIGRPLQVLNLAPHNLNAGSRPEWFFQKERYGGILTDIGSHQFEQFLHFSSASEATLLMARTANLNHPEFPGLEDFGEASLLTDTGVSCYCRVDWFNPGGSRTWGDGRTFVLGTEGYLEIRKNIDVARETGGNRIFLVDGKSEQEIDCEKAVGFPYFGRFLRDVLDRTEIAMTQAHCFKAAELSMKAQKLADR